MSNEYCPHGYHTAWKDYVCVRCLHEEIRMLNAKVAELESGWERDKKAIEGLVSDITAIAGIVGFGGSATVSDAKRELRLLVTQRDNLRARVLELESAAAVDSDRNPESCNGLLAERDSLRARVAELEKDRDQWRETAIDLRDTNDERGRMLDLAAGRDSALCNELDDLRTKLKRVAEVVEDSSAWGSRTAYNERLLAALGKNGKGGA